MSLQIYKNDFKNTKLLRLNLPSVSRACYFMCLVSFFMSISITTAAKVKYQRYKGRTNQSVTSTVPPVRVINKMRIGDEEVAFRVVHGKLAKRGDVPYQVGLKVQLMSNKIWATYCGGTIITAKEVLSAAHCFHKSSFWDMCFGDGRAKAEKVNNRYAVAGQLTTFSRFHSSDSETHGQWRQIRTAIYPKDFRFPTNDIVVVFLKQPFRFNDYVQPIKYTTQYHDYTSYTCLLSGFGRIDSHDQSRYLRMAPLRTLSNSKCGVIHHDNMAKFICTSDSVSDIGRGDSGGPLVCRESDDKNMTLVGIVSGKGRSMESGSFFTRVSAHSYFIDYTLKHDSEKLSLTIPCYILVFVCWIL